MKRWTTLGVMAAVMATQASCFLLPKRTYSSDIGVPGVPLDEGELAGVWASQLEFATIITVPIFGDRNSGTNGGRLMTVTWDGAAKKYRLTFKWCWDTIYEVEGTRNTIPDANLDRLRSINGDGDVNHDAGHFRAYRLLDLWGLQNMPDPYNTPLPGVDNYKQSPQSDWVYDEDMDGKVGVTSVISGSADGEAYFINRGVFTLNGVAKTKTELLGLLEQETVEQVVLESTVNLPGGLSTGRSEVRAEEDPKESWFQAVKLGSTGTCQDVKDAKADGRLSSGRPF
jgi:hypothetical protein